MDHVTAVLLVPVTFAVNELDAPGSRVTVDGTTVIATAASGVEAMAGTSVMEELAVSAELVALDAIKVTFAWVVTDAGAM
jgi:hypothetical protein